MPAGDGTVLVGQGRASIGLVVVLILQDLRINVDVLIVDIMNNIRESFLITPKNVLNAILK